MKNWQSQRIVKFLGVGILNTLFGYSIYAVLIFINLPYLIALFIATLAGIAFNYFSFGKMVFRIQGEWFIFGKFIIAYALVYTVNAALLIILTGKLHLNAYLAQGICIPPSVAISWILMNYWVYKNRLEA